MFDFLWLGAFAPFTISLGLLFGLLTLELVTAFLGGSLLSLGEEVELDLDVPDIEIGDMSDLDGFDLEGIDLEGAEVDMEASYIEPPAGLAAWLGFGRVPVMIWVAAFLLGFGLSGMALQLVMTDVLAWALPVSLAVIPAAVAGTWFARSFGALFARLLPKTETEALSERHLGRRKGVVTAGTARRGHPAEVRVTDRYGNTHHIRAEPLRDEDAISQGSEVLVLRAKHDDRYLLVGLSD
jgi:hypothetical protein